MTRKLEIDIHPHSCTECGSADGCYFGKFFANLKMANCKVSGSRDRCKVCSIYDSCTLSKFEISTSIVLAPQDLMPCVTK
jgi:hypothetical protein